MVPELLVDPSTVEVRQLGGRPWERQKKWESWRVLLRACLLMVCLVPHIVVWGFYGFLF